jgi:putative MATE family efflux protein
VQNLCLCDLASIARLESRIEGDLEMRTTDLDPNIDVDVGTTGAVPIASATIDQPETPVKPMSREDEVIIKGSTWAAIWHMAWPLFLNMVTIAVGSFADLYVAGKLGSDAQAAIGMGGQIWFFMVLLAVALSAGTNALISRFWGEGSLEKTIQAARQSILFAVIFGVASAAVGLLTCRWLLRVLGASPAVEAQGWEYLKYDLLAQMPFTVLWVTNSIFRAKGSAKVPMLIMMLITAQVVALDFALCIWPLKLGIAGIGMSWGIASILGVILSFYILKRSDIGACLDVRTMLKETSWEWFGRLMKIGVPACVQDLAWVGGNFVLFAVFAHTAHPTAAQASWAVGFRIEEMIGGFPIYALSMAVATIVGQNLGAKQPDRAERAGWQVTAIGAGLNTVIALVLFLGAEPIARAMSSDPLVIQYSVQYLQVVGVSQPFLAVWLVLMGGLNGSGYTRWPMYATVLCLVVLRLPLAWYLTVNQSMGPMGTWISLSVSNVLCGLLFAWRFKTGVWKTQKV